MSSVHNCPACAAPGMRPFFQLNGVPLHSMLLLEDRAEALRYPTGNINLAFCETCGFISNLAFDPSLMEYSPNYESSQAFSPRFNAFAEDLASRLITRYDLRDKEIVEIGCGGGDFLALMTELGGNRGVGIDPAAGVGQEKIKDLSRISFIRDYYTERYRHYQGDMFLCRHTLEHIWDTGDFVATVRRTVGDRQQVPVVFELPDVTRVLREVAFWDIYYEHCSYFSAGSLAKLFTDKGFDVKGVSLEFDDQYLLLEAFPGQGGQPSSQPGCAAYLEELSQDVAHYATAFPQKVQEWKMLFQRAAERGQRCIVWGGGSKGVAFLNTLGFKDEIDYVVDINPLKQNMYVAGTGHEIVGPEFLRQRKPDIILVMNPIYCGEIGRMVSDLGINAELVPA